MEVTVEIKDAGVLSGKYIVKDLNTIEMARIQDKVRKKYRSAGESEVRVRAAREIFCERIVNWELESGIPCTREKKLLLYDKKPDLAARIIDEADTILEEELEREFLD